MKNAVLFLIALLVLSSACLAQPIRRAQKKMVQYNYSRAIQILNKVIDHPKYHDEAIPLLAECYRRQRDIPKAKLWYEKSMELPRKNPEWLLYYGQMLFASAEYAKAKEVYLQYLIAKPGNVAVNDKMKQCETLLNEWANLKPSYEIKSLKNINTAASDFGASIYANGFTFASDRGEDLLEGENYGWTGRKYLKLLYTKPLKTGDFFGDFKEPILMNSRFNQSFHDGPACFTGDTIAMFTRTIRDNKSKKVGNIKTNFLKIYSTQRVLGDWQKLTPFFHNSYDYSVGHPSLNADGSILYFVSDMPGGQGGTDIWMCKINDNQWSKPVNLGPIINSKDNEMFPSVRGDGALFYASDGLPGYGGLDIFVSKPESGTFTTPQNLLAPINSSYDDFAITWIPGTNYGLFSSDRPGGMGSDDIYAFKKLPDISPKFECKQPLSISGLVLDKITRKPIEGALVFVLNENNDSVCVLRTDSDGRYRMYLLTVAPLIVKATQSNYIPDCLSWKEDKLTPSIENIASRALLLSRLEINKIFVLENIYYDFDKSNIRPDAEPALDKLIRIMEDNPIKIELASHTDCRGSFAYNEKLSLRRAKSATEYIINEGIDAERVTSKGYGEYQLTNRCADGIPCSPAEHQANRRTEFRVLSFMQDNLPKPDSFNPENFQAGKKVSRELLPSDFFMNCK